MAEKTGFDVLKEEIPGLRRPWKIAGIIAFRLPLFDRSGFGFD